MSKMLKIVIILLAVWVCFSEAGSFKRVKSLATRRPSRPKARVRHSDSRNERFHDRSKGFSNRRRGSDSNDDYVQSAETVFKRKKSFGKSDRTGTRTRYSDSRNGRFGDRSEESSNRFRGWDEGEDDSQFAETTSKRKKSSDTRKAGKPKTSYSRGGRKSHRSKSQNDDDDNAEKEDSSTSESYDSESVNSAAEPSIRRTIDSSDSIKSAEKNNVDETKPDITFEDFDVQNEDIRTYVNNLRKRVTRLEKIRVKFAAAQSNHILRYRMDTIETKYLNNIKFIEEFEDYNKTIRKLISTFNDKRKTNGWTQMVNVSKIIVMEAVKDEAGNDTRYRFAELPKTFLTRYEKWYAGAVWLQSLPSEKWKELETSYPALFQLREGILKEFPEGPISIPEIVTGMDNLYGIVSTNVKTCLNIRNVKECKMPRKPLKSYKRDTAVSKCAEVLISLEKI